MNNYDHFVVTADCLEELVTARVMDVRILQDRSGEFQETDEKRVMASDHHPVVAFFRTSGVGVSRDRTN